MKPAALMSFFTSPSHWGHGGLGSLIFWKWSKA